MVYRMFFMGLKILRTPEPKKHLKTSTFSPKPEFLQAHKSRTQSLYTSMHPHATQNAIYMALLNCHFNKPFARANSQNNDIIKLAFGVLTSLVWHQQVTVKTPLQHVADVFSRGTSLKTFDFCYCRLI